MTSVLQGTCMCLFLRRGTTGAFYGAVSGKENRRHRGDCFCYGNWEAVRWQVCDPCDASCSLPGPVFEFYLSFSHRVYFSFHFPLASWFSYYFFASWLINHEDHLKTFLEVDENLISFEKCSPTVHSAVSPCPFLLKLWSETDFYQ